MESFHIDDEYALFRLLEQGTLLGVSDGSVLNENWTSHGAHSYVFSNYNTDDGSISGFLKTPESTTLTSLTPELYGLIAATLILLCLEVHFDM